MVGLSVAVRCAGRGMVKINAPATSIRTAAIAYAASADSP